MTIAWMTSHTRSVEGGQPGSVKSTRTTSDSAVTVPVIAGSPTAAPSL